MNHDAIQAAFEAGWKVNALQPECYPNMTEAQAQSYLNGCMNVDFREYMDAAYPPKDEQGETFAVPEQSRETVRAVERIVRDQMITAAFVLNASGLSERQANSLVANIVAKLAWEMNKAERKSAGEIPDPDRFLSMVKDHVQ